MSISFKIIYESKKSYARVGEITTTNGKIETPNFIAVGTNGVIKALDSTDLEKLSLPIIFCNTYHLMLHPGEETISAAGGIHNFANLKVPIITDSGGFQVFSLKYGGVFEELKSRGKKQEKNAVLSVSEDGVLFRSYRDGSPVFLSPETSIGAQKKIGADIIVAFDELLPFHIEKKYQQLALERTHRWAVRSLEAHKKNISGQGLYAVVHGGVDEKMRKESIDFLSQYDFDGFAVGGSLGRNLSEMTNMLKFAMPRLPKNKPNHLLGIADLRSIPECIPLGVDTFDGSYPTKAARHGLLFSDQHQIKINQTINKSTQEPIEKLCKCFTCQNYTVGYLHHLWKTHELSFYRLASIHNLHFMVNKMKFFREQILAGLI